MSVSINHLVSIILLVLLIPSSILIIHSGIHERENQKKHNEDKLWQLTDFVTANQDDAITSIELIAHYLFHLSEVSSLNAQSIKPVLAKIMENNHQIENIIIADSYGKVVSAASLLSKPVSIANHRCFNNAKITKKPASGEYDATIQPGNSVVCFGFPILTKHGDFNGLILIQQKVRFYENLIKKADFTSNCNISIFDYKGTRVYSHLFPEHMGQSDQPENFALMQSSKEDRGIFESLGSDGNLRLFCFRKILLSDEETPYLYIRVGLPMKTVYADVNRKFLFEVLGFVTITFVSFLFAWLLGKRFIVNRIKQLNIASQALADNNLDICIPTFESSELGRLAMSFNHMVSQLRERDSSRLLYEEELMFNESKFESLYKLSLMAEDTEQAILSFALEEGIRLAESSIGYLCQMNDDETAMTVTVCSKSAKQECQSPDKPFEINVADVGLWSEAIRRKIPVITNDNTALNPLKTEYPYGHMQIIRHVDVPLIVDNKIVMIIGVSNKLDDYSDKDVLILTLIVDGLWKLMERKRAVTERLKNERLLDTLLNADFESICLMTTEYIVVKANEIFAMRLNCKLEDMCGRSVFDFYPPEISESRKIKYDQVIETLKPLSFEDRLGTVDLINSVNPVLDASGAVAFLAIYSVDVSQLKEFEYELITANAKLQALNQKIEDAREEERRHIARELHDQMGQALTGLNLDLNWLIAQLDQNSVQKLDNHIIGMHITVESMIAMVQTITARLSPPLLENLGLAPAIGYYVQDFERKSGIACHLMLDEVADSYFDKDESIAIFRILQESLTNVARHADAVEVAVSLCLTRQSVVLEVADNGKGITDEEINSPGAFGMLGMEERARKINGLLKIQVNPLGGTIIRLEIPKTNGGCK